MEQEIIEELGFELEPVRYVYYFSDEINIDSVQGLIDILISYPAIDLYVETLGGSLTAMNVLLHFINNHPDIVIYLTSCIASAGTLFLTDCNKKVILTEDLDVILFHLADRGTEGQFRKRTIDDKILYEQLKEFNEKFVNKFVQLGLNKKEIKGMLEGDDIILYRKDFKRIEKNINK